MSSGSRSVTIAAMPEPVTIDTARTAGIIVDMQNDFGAKGGMFDLAGHDLSLVRKTITPTARVLAGLRRAGIRIVYLKMGYRPDLSDLGPPDSPNRLRHRAVGSVVKAPDGRESRILIRDTWNTDILDELKPEPDEAVIYKTRYSGFHGTDLDSLLRQHQVKWLIVAGLSTSVCVESTIRDAMFRDYFCLLVADCAAEPVGQEFTRGNHEASLLVIQVRFGWTAGSGDILRALDQSDDPELSRPSGRHEV
jgi:ureidoacrylate peracid hydrolase